MTENLHRDPVLAATLRDLAEIGGETVDLDTTFIQVASRVKRRRLSRRLGAGAGAFTVVAGLTAGAVALGAALGPSTPQNGGAIAPIGARTEAQFDVDLFDARLTPEELVASADYVFEGRVFSIEEAAEGYNLVTFEVTTYLLGFPDWVERIPAADSESSTLMVVREPVSNPGYSVFSAGETYTVFTDLHFDANGVSDGIYSLVGGVGAVYSGLQDCAILRDPEAGVGQCYVTALHPWAAPAERLTLVDLAVLAQGRLDAEVYRRWVSRTLGVAIVEVPPTGEGTIEVPYEGDDTVTMRPPGRLTNWRGVMPYLPEDIFDADLVGGWDRPAVSWGLDPGVLYVTTWGSSSCPLIGSAINWTGDDQLEITLSMISAFSGEALDVNADCTDDLSPHTTILRAPEHFSDVTPEPSQVVFRWWIHDCPREGVANLPNSLRAEGGPVGVSSTMAPNCALRD